MLLGLGALPLGAATVNWGSSYASQLSTSTGDTIDSSYTIEMGVFVNDFVPTQDNVALWQDNWRTVDVAEYNPGEGYFTGTFDIRPDGSSTGQNSDAGVVFSNMTAYVWVHSNGPEDNYPEYFLAHSSGWVLPDAPMQDCCDGTLPVQWSINDLANGETPVFGAHGAEVGAGAASQPGIYDLQTYVVYAVPEPGTLGITLMSVGLLLRRRRTKHE